MSEEDIKDPAKGAEGIIFDESDKAPPKRKRGRPRKKPVEEPASAETAPKKKRGRPPKKAVEVELLEKRVEELETRIAATVPETHTCVHCHKGGARTQRGNTGEYYHEPCLREYRNGADPLPLPE